MPRGKHHLQTPTMTNYLVASRNAGTGKTSTVLAIARQLYGSNKHNMTLELNASDDRGISVVRQEIQDFASTKSVFSKSFKLIILDECDAMTKDAQFALRRVIEKYARCAFGR
jgi:replication factor C subunit 3/5